jgi:twitching motility protein PilT
MTDITMNDLLAATIEYGASDLHVRANMPPELRVHGELQPIADEDLSPEDTYELCRQICSPEQLEEVEKNGGADFAVAHEDGTRFRVSVFKERKKPSLKGLSLLRSVGCNHGCQASLSSFLSMSMTFSPS